MFGKYGSRWGAWDMNLPQKYCLHQFWRVTDFPQLLEAPACGKSEHSKLQNEQPQQLFLHPGPHGFFCQFPLSPSLSSSQTLAKALVSCSVAHCVPVSLNSSIIQTTGGNIAFGEMHYLRQVVKSSGVCLQGLNFKYNVSIKIKRMGNTDYPGVAVLFP